MKKRVLTLLLTLTLSLALSPQSRAVRTEAAPVFLPVVMYHHVSKNPKKWNDYVISPEELAADLDYLADQGWHSVSVKELLDWYDGRGTLPEKPFMITFDDGFESTMAYAAPILASHGFQGVVAVIGSVCEKFSACGEHDPELSNLSWEDAAALAEDGVFEVQCHTWDMHSLSGRRGCQQRRGESDCDYAAHLAADLARFRSACDSHGVRTVPAIAYPYGAYSPETDQIALAQGFRLAFTCEEQVNILPDQPPPLLRLGRFNRPHGAGSAQFFSKWKETPNG